MAGTCPQTDGRTLGRESTSRMFWPFARLRSEGERTSWLVQSFGGSRSHRTRHYEQEVVVVADMQRWGTNCVRRGPPQGGPHRTYRREFVGWIPA
jgi:hypothetical protein